MFHARTKHVEALYCFIGEKIHKADIHMNKYKNEDQVVDILMNGLNTSKFGGF